MEGKRGIEINYFYTVGIFPTVMVLKKEINYSELLLILLDKTER